MDSSSIENFLSARVFFYTYWNYQMNLKFVIELERTQIAVCRNILILAINERRRCKHLRPLKVLVILKLYQQKEKSFNFETLLLTTISLKQLVIHNQT